MWCANPKLRCHYGSETGVFKRVDDHQVICPNCGYVGRPLLKNPFLDAKRTQQKAGKGKGEGVIDVATQPDKIDELPGAPE